MRAGPMDDVLFARAQMGMSLGFHIVFACIGIALPLLSVIAEWMWLSTKDREYLDLARTWSRGTAVLFAVGAVSGTVLSFELGLLFPGFMRQAGPLVGMPFSLEGIAFFTEAIFLGVYLYGWDKIRPTLHLAAGILVALSGACSAIFVTLVNAWMNAPTGMRVLDGAIVAVDPIAAMASPAALHEVLHMVVAAYMATAFAVAAIHAFVLLRRSPGSGFHRKALAIALLMAVPTTLLQPLVGHDAAQKVALLQPAKLAAMEGQYETERGAPLRIGGLPSHAARETRYAVEIPRGLSWLAFGDLRAEVRGLEEWPRADWPSPFVHVAFQIMVGLGSMLALVAAWAAFVALRRRTLPEGRAFLWAVLASGPLGFVAVEAGWIVTELGRQPWVVQDVLRTADTVTPMPGLVVPFTTFTVVYLGLSVAVIALVRGQVRASPGAREAAR